MAGELAALEVDARRAEALVGHYQKTYELTLKFWEQRNRLFVVLVSVIAGAVLLTHAEQPTIKLASNALMKAADVSGVEAEEIKAAIPNVFKILIAMLLLCVFYLMGSLFHRTQTIVKYYVYLAHMEAEIRRELRIDPKSIAFTRESTFYFRHNGLASRLIGQMYRLVLGGLLVSFFAFRLIEDWPRSWPDWQWQATYWASLSGLLQWVQANFLLLVDVIVGIPTFILFAGYIGATFWGGIDNSDDGSNDRNTGKNA